MNGARLTKRGARFMIVAMITASAILLATSVWAIYLLLTCNLWGGDLA